MDCGYLFEAVPACTNNQSLEQKSENVKTRIVLLFAFVDFLVTVHCITQMVDIHAKILYECQLRVGIAIPRVTVCH